MTDAPVSLSSRLRALKDEWSCDAGEDNGLHIVHKEAMARCADALDLLIPASEALEQADERFKAGARAATAGVHHATESDHWWTRGYAWMSANLRYHEVEARCAALEREIAELKAGEVKCLCGRDTSPDGFRYDIVCPKHDQRR